MAREEWCLERLSKPASRNHQKPDGRRRLRNNRRTFPVGLSTPQSAILSFSNHAASRHNRPSDGLLAGLPIASLRRSKNARTSCSNSKSSALSESRTRPAASVITRTSSGQSQHMRGTQHLEACGHLGLRTIPAYAGNTRVSRLLPGLRWDHPRVCGEHRATTATFTHFARSGGPLAGYNIRKYEQLVSTVGTKDEERLFKAVETFLGIRIEHLS